MLAACQGPAIRIGPGPGTLAGMSEHTAPDLLALYGPAPPQAPALPLVLDSPHSGRCMPPDFGAAVPEAALRDGEDAFIDALYRPAAERLGIPLLAAQFPRTYLDANRHADDIDPLLMAEPWPGPVLGGDKARIGKALLWRTLVNGTPIYSRKLSVAEVQARIERCHRPYHAMLQQLLEAAHARHGVVLHINCHSMGPTTSVDMEGVDGQPRPDFILGDRDGSTCHPAITEAVATHLRALGWQVAVNAPFKGVELVRAYSNPAAGRHSLQLEINKRLYMDTTTLAPHAGFEPLQHQLEGLLRLLAQRFGADAPG